MEPLTCRGRRGTGIQGTRRSGYVDEQLDTRWDWEKYSSWYRVWGRLTYDADVRPRTSVASVRHRSARPRAVHGPRTRQPDSADGDHRASAVGGMRRLLAGGLLEPADRRRAAAQSLRRHARAQGVRARQSARSRSSSRASRSTRTSCWRGRPVRNTRRSRSRPGSRRWRQTSIGIWPPPVALTRSPATAGWPSTRGSRPVSDASSPRSSAPACCMRSTNRPGSPGARRCAASYRRARAAWAALAEEARGVYAADLSVSDKLSERGQWIDRLAGIDEDIARMEARAAATVAVSDEPRVRARGGARARHRRQTARSVHAHAAGRVHAAGGGASRVADRGWRSGGRPLSLSAREPGRALHDPGDGEGGLRPPSQYSSRLHGFSVSSSGTTSPCRRRGRRRRCIRDSAASARASRTSCCAGCGPERP